MLIWTLVVVFETSWLLVSCVEPSDDVVALIQLTHQKYCGQYNCRPSETANISLFMDVTTVSFPPVPVTCPPCYRCSCKRECVIFGDCCPDLHIGPPLYPFRCVGVPAQKDVVVKYFLVSECSSTSRNYSPELAERCHGFQLDRFRDGVVSARVSTAGVETNVTFLNRYCAECHGVFNSVSWKVIVECTVFPKPSDIANLQDFLLWAVDNCWIGFIPPNQRIKKCKFLESEITSTCNETGYWVAYNSTVAEACSAYYNPLIQERFSNMFCFMCNGFPEDVLQDKVECIFRPPFGWNIQPFSAILNFDETPDKYSLPDQCKGGEFEDTVSNTCRKILCPSLQQLKGENCTSLLNSAHGFVLKLTIVLIPKEPLELDPILSNGNLIRHIIRRIHSTRWFIILNVTVMTYLYETLEMNHTKEQSNYKRQNQNDTIVTDTTSDNTTAQQSTYPPMQDTPIVAYVKITAHIAPPLTTRMAVLEESLLAIQYEPLTIIEPKHVIFHSTPSMYFNTNKFNISTEGLKPVLTDRFDNERATIPSTAAFLEIPSPHLQCPQVEFEKNEYERAVNNSIFIIPDSLHIYEPNYEITESLNLRVCLDHLKQVINTTDPRVPSADPSIYIMQILTGLCLGVSLLCLLLCFITHCVFAEMRTLPGINLMLLSSSLFASQALYLVGAGATDNRVVCTAMGVLIHYSWLVSFAWMGVCSFHVFRVFRNLFSALNFNDNKKAMLIKYAVFSYTVPGVFIVLHILVHYFTLEERSIGYSDEMIICFIKPGLLSIPFFALPVGLTVLLTTVFFVHTCIILHKSSKQRSTVGIQESVSVFRFFKLASMTGLSWLFGFLGAILKVNAFAYIFIILAGGQGVFVFLSFSFSRRIWNKYVSCLCCARKKKDQQTESTASTTLDTLSSKL